MPTDSTRKGHKTAAKSGIPIPILVLSIVALVALLGGLYYMNFVPRRFPAPIHMSPEMTLLNDWIHKKAFECKGDFNKLSPEDQQYLQQNTRGMGQMIMENVYKGTTN